MDRVNPLTAKHFPFRQSSTPHGSREFRASAGGRRWRTERWRLRRGHVFLVPGDSAAGYRLPLSSLPFVPPAAYPYINPADPTVPRDPLPAYTPPEPVPTETGRKSQPMASFVPGQPATPGFVPQVEVEGAVRTALSVEPRGGTLCIFMPPVTELEDYLDLLHAAEAAGQRLGKPIRIEGYAPPTTPG